MVVCFILYVNVQVYTFFKPFLACNHLLIAVSVTPKLHIVCKLRSSVVTTRTCILHNLICNCFLCWLTKTINKKPCGSISIGGLAFNYTVFLWMNFIIIIILTVIPIYRYRQFLSLKSSFTVIGQLLKKSKIR